MSPVERFIARHKAARYAFVAVSFPLVFVRGEARKLRDWEPDTDLDDLRVALVWARTGGALPYAPTIPTATEPARIRTARGTGPAS